MALFIVKREEHMEKEGIVSKIIYKNEKNQYVVFVVETEDGDDETYTLFHIYIVLSFCCFSVRPFVKFSILCFKFKI